MSERLRESERAKLRNWYDDSGPWNERMSALYRIVEAICDKRVAEALAFEYDRQRQYDKPPEERVEPPWTGEPPAIDAAAIRAALAKHDRRRGR